MRFISLAALMLLSVFCACVSPKKHPHGDWCAEKCVHATNERALEHLEYMRAQNCRKLESEKDERSAATIREIISGIDAHIDYIKNR